MTKTYLVTGGAGFIGSHLANTLNDRGHDVIALDDFSLGVRSNLDDEVDILNRDVCRIQQSDLEGVDGIFHNAARSSAPMHKDSPTDGLDVNVNGFVHTMEQARKVGVEDVIYASTSSMYGSVDPPHRENMGEHPTNLYAASKMSRELYGKVYAETYGMNVTGLRYFSVYGENERHKGQFANLVSQFCWKLLNDERPVIYGDGEQTRDFTYVGDIVKGNIQAMHAAPGDGSVYNLATGNSCSVNEMVTVLQDEIGSDVEPKHIENPLDNYVRHTNGEYQKARETFGFNPQIDLKQGIRKVVAAYGDR